MSSFLQFVVLSFKISWVLLLLLILNYLFSLKFTLLYFNLTDVLYRVNANDAIFNLYSFFWTNFWYIPIFFLCFLTLNLFLFNKNINFFFFIALYIYEISDIYSINLHLNIFNTFNIDLNNLLSNNLNKYHPGFFYFSVILFICLYKKKINFFLWYSDCCHIQRYSLYLHIYNIILFALFLGSWWAAQEGTWGGWWNWDSSETFGFLILIFVLILVHMSIKFNLMFFYYKIFNVYLLFFFFIYFFLQFNFDLVSHNFGLRFFFFFNNTFFFIENLIFFFVLLSFKNFLFYKQFFFIKFYFKKIYVFKYLQWSNILINFVVLYLLLKSFLPLIIYFLWIFFCINFNFDIITLLSTEYVNIIFLFALFIFFLKELKFRKYFAFLLITPDNLTIFYIAKKLNIIKFLHLFFFLFSYINIVAYNAQIFNLNFTSSRLPLLCYNDIIWHKTLLINFDYSFLKTIFQYNSLSFLNNSISNPFAYWNSFINQLLLNSIFHFSSLVVTFSEYSILGNIIELLLINKFFIIIIFCYVSINFFFYFWRLKILF